MGSSKNVKARLTIMSFMQFFVWGAWLITIANYWFNTKGWSGSQFGLIFATMGIASVFMPTIAGIIADKWVNTERLYGVLHVLYGGCLFYLSTVTTPDQFFWVMLVAMFFYMPTIALSNSISYDILKSNGYDVVKDFPPIRVFGTIGFIVAMIVTNLSGNKATQYQFIIAAVAAVLLGIYSFTLPACKPKGEKKGDSWLEILGLNAFKLFANYKMALFFGFSMCLGAALQLTNAYGDVFLDEFKFFPKYADSLIVKYSTIILAVSQVSETLFILAIPYFLKRFGIKTVMLISMLAWVLRFAFLGLGDPGTGLWMIIVSCIVYGMAFDFFNVSGSLFVETSTEPSMRSSAQGLFMMMTNGFGAILGNLIAGNLIDSYFTKSFTQISDLATYLDTTTDNPTLLAMVGQKGAEVLHNGVLSIPINIKEWTHIWMTFAAYSLVVAILFAIFFKHKHKSGDDVNL
ncbi:nucleoside permease [Myroides sp. LJL119]